MRNEKIKYLPSFGIGLHDFGIGIFLLSYIIKFELEPFTALAKNCLELRLDARKFLELHRYRYLLVPTGT